MGFVLTEYAKNEGLIKHALAIEAAMRAYGHKLGEDGEKWDITGPIAVRAHGDRLGLPKLHQAHSVLARRGADRF